MSKKSTFPWTVFSANTLRPMVAEIMRSGNCANPGLNKEASLALLEKIEKHGLDTALKDYAPAKGAASTSTASKRKHAEEPDEDDEDEDGAEPPPKRRGSRASRRRDQEKEEEQEEATDSPRRSSRRRAKADQEEDDEEEEVSAPLPKRRGRPPKRRDEDQVAAAPKRRGRPPKQSTSVSAPVRASTRSRSRPGPGLQTRRQAAQSASARSPVKPKPASVRSRSGARKAVGASAPLSTGKPKSKAIFDGVELVKRPESQRGKDVVLANGVNGDVGLSDEDAEGDMDGMEVDASSLENSNKENDRSLLDIANAESGTEPDIDLPPSEEIGSPAPQINVEPIDDQIEEARNNELSFHIGSPAPEITIEPTAEEGGLEENGHTSADGLLRPRLEIRAGSVELNPEYTIQVFSPAPSQHGDDEDQWDGEAANVNGSPVLPAGSQASGSGMNSLD
ncbi:hypothetical protein FB45DRAFT_900307 [Roridomyces roridus]|uniref:Uncharacterized protein n=1 Tax=Roridomyces roridus TaxID=1738132 RepID=A0AAD7FWN0_9AGAR|nr:hypothetical protein FB45DRAFT_900307 [Roridomyces roridus]